MKIIVFLFLIFLLGSCASKLILKNCEHVGQDLFRCEKIVGRDFK
jgi:Ca2+/Na+ antiporter